MVFSSTIFIYIFLPITLLAYYLINPKFKNTLLLIVSLLFYAWGEPRFVFIMIISIFVNYVFGLLVDEFRDIKKIAYSVIGLMVAYNISIFFVYKYMNFTIANINNLLHANIPQTNIVLPIGISFFTFQAMSYVIDVYRQNGKVQKNPLEVGLYITFFPQLIAGPIVRYETVSDQIKNRKETVSDFAEGVRRFIVGLGKKVIISNGVALIADQAFGITNFGELSVGMAWLGAIAYSLQIFFDFSGYSDMAIGLGKMFGFHFNENFDYPYISKSVSEFWRRWHISLGTWFRDYVYFPLGGSRVKSRGRLIFNLFVVWSLTGIWHGANWTFLMWGLLYFVVLTFEKLTNYPKKFKSWIAIGLYRIFTLLCIILGWVLFNSKSIRMAIEYMKAMFGLNGNLLWTTNAAYYLKTNLVVLVIAILFCTPIAKKFKSFCEVYEFPNKVYNIGRPVIYVLLFLASLAYTVTSTYNPFIYFNF